MEGNVVSSDLATTFTPVNSPLREMEEHSLKQRNRSLKRIGLYNVQCTS